MRISDKKSVILEIMQSDREKASAPRCRKGMHEKKSVDHIYPSAGSGEDEDKADALFYA